ncbi:UNVERIFIED_CONTAM: hypothetical protein K2H54_043169 [Gekko kuhli]
MKCKEQSRETRVARPSRTEEEQPDTKGETEKETNTPKKKESKVSMSKNSKLLSTSAKRIQKELADITLDPPPNCSAVHWGIINFKTHA